MSVCVCVCVCVCTGADVGKEEGMHGTRFRYPSYVQDIMGDIFSLGFGPFRYPPSVS